MYTRDNLLFDDYVWPDSTPMDQPVLIAAGDNRHLNRADGYSMLDLLNCLALTWQRSPGAAVLSCQRLEQIVRYDLPSSIRTYGVIREWIERRYIGVFPTASNNGI